MCIGGSRAPTARRQPNVPSGKCTASSFYRCCANPCGSWWRIWRARPRAGRVELREFLESLVRNSQTLLPPEIGGGSVVHFNSIVAALLLLLGRP